MRTFVLRCSAVFSFVLLAFTSSTQAQLPEGWNQLPPTEFITLVESLDEEGKRTGEDYDLTRDHAASLLLNLISTDKDYGMLVKLQRIGRRHFHKNAGDMQKLRDALKARQDNWTGKHYDIVRAKRFLMDYIGMDIDLQIKEIRTWRELGGDISQLHDEDLPYLHLFYSKPEIVTSSFTVTWEGKVTAPTTGSYTFSISPINVNAIYNNRYRSYHLQQSMTVTVAGQQLISATPEKWDWKGAPISLTANQPVPVKVTYQVDSPKLPQYALNALLSWEGPGIIKQIVPASQFTLADGSGAGLKATYAWSKDGQDKSLTITEDNIDSLWSGGILSLSQDHTYQKQGVEMLWQRSMTNESLDDYATTGGNVGKHPLLSGRITASDALSSAQRKQFLNELISRPGLLTKLDPTKIGQLFRSFRFGAEEAALEVLGLWAIQHADHTTPVVNSMSISGVNQENRMWLRMISDCIGHQLPEQLSPFQNNYLELEDGSCSLPAAYILSYGYMGQGKHQEWIDFLNTKLNESSITGDKRVNWLIARAHADEIKLSTPKPYIVAWDRPMAGKTWLDEASLVAESPEIKARVACERAARLTRFGKFDEARTLLDMVVSSSPDEVADWKKSIDALETELDRKKALHAEESRKAYVATLKKRQSKAASSGNTEAANRYNALIEAAEAQ